jgi:hypothetical protein
MMQQSVPEMRMITPILMNSSKKSIGHDGELNGVDSDEPLRSGMEKFSWIRPPLDAILHRDDQQGDALLPDNLLDLGVVGIVGYPENSGELTSAW